MSKSSASHFGVSGDITRSGTLIWSPMPNFRYRRNNQKPGLVEEFVCPRCNMKFRSSTQLQHHELKFCVGNVPGDEDEEFTLADELVLEYYSQPHLPSDSKTAKTTDDSKEDNKEVEQEKSDNVGSETVTVKYPKFQWIKCTNGNIPKYPVKVGYDLSIKSEIYVGRARVGPAKVPGKVVPSHNCAYVSTRGLEVKVTEYEVLNDPSDLLSWKQCETYAGIPKGTQKGGYDDNRLMVFVARTTTPDGRPSCGMYLPHLSKCLYPWEGKEHSSEKFDLLCKK